MASKRTFDEEDRQNNDDTNLQTVAKRRRGETINHSLLTVLEPHLRKLGGSSGGRALQLCFVNGLPQITFTMANLTAKDGGPLEIELRNAASQQRVDTEEISTMKAQIYVLDGDFGNEEWTAEEFDDNIVKPREGKGPLLRGETVIKIVKGVGSINKKMIKITDNSCTTRTKTFRLGVKIVGSNSLGGIRVREAISEPFRVKDKRGEATKKPERPSLNDEVWRLKHIGKAGKLCKQLSLNGIKTVKDLLRLNTIGSLREKFSKIHTWDKIIEHAKDCELDGYERYIYRYRATEQLISVSLVFNCIYELVEVNFNGQHRSLQSLNSEEKCLVGRIKLEAHSNLQHLEPFETQTHDIVRKLTGTQVAPYSAPYQGLQLPAQQGQLETWPSPSTSFIDEAVNNALVVDSNPWLVVPEETYSSHELFECYLTPNPNQWEQPNFYSFACGDDGASCSTVNHSFLPNTAGYMPKKGKTRTVWQKIRNTLKWVLQPHKAKRKNQMFFCGQN